jgi:predicted ribosome quality control (RQC) complex YloA/Tae2 family protein
VPRRTLEEAALLAAHFSSVQGDAVVSVRYTERKFVKKPPKAPPGMVSIGGAKNIDIRLDSARLQRLLQSKVE